jgi:hypothetical protein
MAVELSAELEAELQTAELQTVVLTVEAELSS